MQCRINYPSKCHVDAKVLVIWNSKTMERGKLISYCMRHYERMSSTKLPREIILLKTRDEV